METDFSDMLSLVFYTWDQRNSKLPGTAPVHQLGGGIFCAVHAPQVLHPCFGGMAGKGNKTTGLPSCGIAHHASSLSLVALQFPNLEHPVTEPHRRNKLRGCGGLFQEQGKVTDLPGTRCLQRIPLFFAGLQNEFLFIRSIQQKLHSAGDA